MARKKSFRKEDFDNFPNTFRAIPEGESGWRGFFKNEGELHLELGCGKAELSHGLAQTFPDRNFVGVDVKSDRLWVAANRSQKEKVKNIALLRADILGITDFFRPAEVDGIWITFPDPFPRDKNARRRLTHFQFLKEYAQILKPGGKVQFKTDNRELFLWSLEHFVACGLHFDALTFDLHESPFLNAETGQITFYEQRFLDMGTPINYVRFSLDGLTEPAV